MQVVYTKIHSELPAQQWHDLIQILPADMQERNARYVPLQDIGLTDSNTVLLDETEWHLYPLDIDASNVVHLCTDVALEQPVKPQYLDMYKGPKERPHGPTTYQPTPIT
jgi:hypothetical protein